MHRCIDEETMLTQEVSVLVLAFPDWAIGCGVAGATATPAKNREFEKVRATCSGLYRDLMGVGRWMERNENVDVNIEWKHISIEFPLMVVPPLPSIEKLRIASDCFELPRIAGLRRESGGS
jgi:hypothetical protein